MNSPANKRRERNGVKPLIFVVDDEPLLLELAITVLDPEHYQVKTFRDAETALAAFRTAKPHPELIVTDFAMHEMDGMAFIRSCRRINPRQKIILMSGTVDESIYEDSTTKPDYFLAKPFEARAFVGLIETALAD